MRLTRALVGGIFLVVAIALIARTLAAFAVIVQPYLAFQYDMRVELGMVIGQVLFQWAVLWRRPWRAKLDYALILLGVSGLGAALLWPLLLRHQFSPVMPIAALIYFSLVVGVMFVVHWQLVKRAALPLVLCGTWVVYRLILLVVLVKRP